MEVLKSIAIGVDDKFEKLSSEHGTEDKWTQELERLNPVFKSLNRASEAFGKQLKGELGWRGRLRWPHHEKKAQAILMQVSSLQNYLQTALNGDVLELTSAITFTPEKLRSQILQLDYEMQRLKLNIKDIQETGNCVLSWTAFED